MSNNEIEQVVKDTVKFVEREFFGTTLHERKNLETFLRNRLSKVDDKEYLAEYNRIREQNGLPKLGE